MKFADSFKVGLELMVLFFVILGYSDTSMGMIIADSISEFSDTQGQDNWYYGYYTTPGDSSSWTEMLYYDASWDPFDHDGKVWYEDPDNPWYGASLTEWGGAPNYDEPQSYPIHWAVRRWICEVSGDIIISGTAAEWDTVSHGDGVNTIIYVDGVEVWSHNIPADPCHVYTYEVTVPNVSVGDVIDFAIDPIDNSWYDGTIFTGQVVPEPATLLLLGLGGLLLRSKGK